MVVCASTEYTLETLWIWEMLQKDLKVSVAQPYNLQCQEICSFWTLMHFLRFFFFAHEMFLNQF